MQQCPPCQTGDVDAVLSLVDDVSTWQPGDKVVIASSDYDMDHAETFTLVHCRSCAANQVKFSGQSAYFSIKFPFRFVRKDSLGKLSVDYLSL